MSYLTTEFFHFDEKPTDQEFRDVAGCCGISVAPNASIRWMNSVGTEKAIGDAEVFLRNLGGLFPTDHIGVRYRVLTPTDEYKQLTEKLRELQKSLENANSCHFLDVQYDFVRCKGCQSELSVKHVAELGVNHCPLCNTDLRPAHVQRNIAQINADLGETERLIQSEYRKMEKNAQIMYLIRVGRSQKGEASL